MPPPPLYALDPTSAFFSATSPPAPAADINGDPSSISSIIKIQLHLEGSLGPPWLPTLSTSTTFQPAHFLTVMQNLIPNPNIMSSHLFRADILYDSDRDRALLGYVGDASPAEEMSGLVPHLRAECRPKPMRLPGFEWERTVVRVLVPRKEKVDRRCTQSCHFFVRRGKHVVVGVNRETEGDTQQPHKGEAETEEGPLTRVIVYLPHVQDPEDVPFYHPKVKGVAFVHYYDPWSVVEGDKHCGSTANGLGQRHLTEAQQRKLSQITDGETCTGGLAIHVLPFEETPMQSLQPKLTRTVQRLIETISKHSHGEAAGYEKRVHHDVVVPQKRYQQTYARLKDKYASSIIKDWREVTDPGKHVFEDLGIAAFLIELWRDMYVVVPADERTTGGGNVPTAPDEPSAGALDGSCGAIGETHSSMTGAGMFPGFVDIGAGNGLLVHLLIAEGYKGWGFDVRRRKSWEMYPESVQICLREMILTPSILQPEYPNRTRGEPSAATIVNDGERQIHDGVLESGTFIISNHSDELTLWTPLLAYLNDSPFVAIPCCSHDFDGHRFRAPELGLRSRKKEGGSSRARDKSLAEDKTVHEDVFAPDMKKPQAAETGSLQRRRTDLGDGRQDSKGPNSTKPVPTFRQGTTTSNTSDEKKKHQQPSAYASLCNYVARLTEEMGYVPETEFLRIPSTRNTAVLGRHGKVGSETTERYRGGTCGTFDGKTEATSDWRILRVEVVQNFVERETSQSLTTLRERWFERVALISSKKSDGH